MFKGNILKPDFSFLTQHHHHLLIPGKPLYLISGISNSYLQRHQNHSAVPTKAPLTTSISQTAITTTTTTPHQYTSTAPRSSTTIQHQNSTNSASNLENHEQEAHLKQGR